MHVVHPESGGVSTQINISEAIEPPILPDSDAYVHHCPPHLGWRRGVVASVVRRMNEVTTRRVRLVLGWVTVFWRVYHHGT